MRAKKFRNLTTDPTETHAHFNCNLHLQRIQQKIEERNINASTTAAVAAAGLLQLRQPSEDPKQIVLRSNTVVKLSFEVKHVTTETLFIQTVQTKSFPVVWDASHLLLKHKLDLDLDRIMKRLHPESLFTAELKEGDRKLISLDEAWQKGYLLLHTEMNNKNLTNRSISIEKIHNNGIILSTTIGSAFGVMQSLIALDTQLQSYFLQMLVSTFITGKSKSSTSAMHFDDFHNVLLVLQGSKEFYICPPESAVPDKVTGGRKNHGRSSYDPLTTDKPVHMKVSLTAGQFFYLPQHWWHYVTSTPETIMISYFYLCK